MSDTAAVEATPVVVFDDREWACPTCGFTRAAPIVPRHEHDGVYVAFEPIIDDDHKPRRRRRGQQQ
jgi:hypothetical protein